MMLASSRQCSSVMTLSSSHSSPPKRPRLSLQIKPSAAAQTFGKSSTALKSDVDPTSPTAFNTLSNAYAAAIENASPRTGRPPCDVVKKPTSLQLETKLTKPNDNYVHPSQRTQTPGPFYVTYPDTPSSAFPDSTLSTVHAESKLVKSASSATSTFTFTPPQSAGPDNSAAVFTFAANMASGNLSSPRTARKPSKMSIVTQGHLAPYTHPRALHSILRNSPLPQRSAVIPSISSRVSGSRTNKKVCYNDPLTQTITTNKYIRSHIELLSEDSPFSAEESEKEKPETLDITTIYPAVETRDGSQTPGPFEEMRRRMADSDLETPGTRKRKRKEKKRNWEWTITATDEEQAADDLRLAKTPLATMKVEPSPVTVIWRGASVSSDSDTDAGQSETEDFRNASVDLSIVPEDSEMSDITSSVLQDTRDSIEHSVERSCSPE